MSDKHFFKAGFLDVPQTVQLALMKNDKVIDTVKILPYFMLFINVSW